MHFPPMLRFRSMASASTWSLERLDALAEEVKAEIMRDLNPDSVIVSNVADDGTSEQSAREDTDTKDDRKDDLSAADGMLPDTNASDFRIGEGQSTLGGASALERDTSESMPAQSHGIGKPSVIHGDEGEIIHGEASASLHAEAQGSSHTVDWDPCVIRHHAMRALASVNTVLFERHGYRACNRYGSPSDSQMSSVMEGGVGSSAALSILYLEVCSRIGLDMAARPLEDGR